MTSPDLLADGFSFPTSVTFDPAGTAYVAECGLGFDGAPAGGRVWALSGDGRRELLASGLPAPVNGLVFHAGCLYVSGGAPSGRITRLELDGRCTVILDGLPGAGDYHTNMVAFGPDGRIYFSQGALTNSGVFGLDALSIAWLRRIPQARDVPGFDVVLAGFNAETADPREPGPPARTGAFAPFGVATVPGQAVPAGLPCTAAVLSCTPDGRDLRLVAWGLRNAYGLGFLPDGRLLATDQGADDRGSRPIGDAPDVLVEVHQGAWYGWPDFIAAEPVTAARFRPTRGPAPTFLLADHHRLPPPQRPLLCFPAHTAAVKFAVVPPTWPRWAGQLVVALFGDERPMTGPSGPSGPSVGRSVVRVDTQDWSVHPLVTGGLARPIDVAFHPVDGSLVIVDFGHFEMRDEGFTAVAGSGGVWRLAIGDEAARAGFPRTTGGSR